MEEKMEFNDTQLTNLLSEIGIENKNDVKIKEIVRQDPNQVILLAEYYIGDSETKQLAYVNFKNGSPNTDQVFDSIYGEGKGSDVRIIMFKNENRYNPNRPDSHIDVVDSAITSFDVYKSNQKLVKTDDKCSEFELMNPTDYKFQKIYSLIPSMKMPTELEFRQEEFWSVYYASLYGCFYVPYDSFKFVSEYDFNHMKSLDPIAELYMYWREDQFKYVICKNYWNENLYKKTINAAKPEIIDRYGMENVKYISDNGTIKVEIKIPVIHFSKLMNATPKEKMEFATLLYADVQSLEMLLQNIYRDY